MKCATFASKGVIRYDSYIIQIKYIHEHMYMYLVEVWKCFLPQYIYIYTYIWKDIYVGVYVSG